MSIELTMPSLSPTMEKGNLARWLVAPGDAFAAGAALAEVETDKATMEVEAEDAGVILEFLVPEGSEDVPVGTVIALMRIGSAAASVEDGPGEPEPKKVLSVDAPPPSVPATQPVQVVASAPPPEALMASGLKVTPLARRLAQAAGLDLNSITGSGPGGKIVRADIPGFGASANTPARNAAPELSAQHAPPPGVPYETIRLSGMRNTIARRLTESKQTVPHFYLTADVRLDALLEVRADYNARHGASEGKLSVNDFLIKALAVALERTPEANVQFAGDHLYRFNRVDVSMAVAVPGGLVTPVIVDAARKRISEIAAEARALGETARAGKLAPEAYLGGTVSLSNLGMFGVKDIFPVINPPQAVILGVGAGSERPYSLNRQIISATVMTAVASFDHRAIDGATGAALLATFRTLVEHPFEIVA